MKAYGREIQTQRWGQVMQCSHQHTDAYEVTQTSNPDVFYKTISLKTFSVVSPFTNIHNLENSGLEIAPAVHAPGAVAAVSQCHMQGPCENALQSPAVATSTALRTQQLCFLGLLRPPPIGPKHLSPLLLAFCSSLRGHGAREKLKQLYCSARPSRDLA